MPNHTITRSASDNSHDEARRLSVEIEELQTRLNYLLELEADEDDSETWSVWPYSWAIAGWNQARVCFHSFHQKHNGFDANGFETGPLQLV